MSGASDRNLAALFGILAAVFLGIEAIFDLVTGVVYLAFGRSGGRALGAFDEGVIFLVLALIVAVFAFVGRARHTDRSVAAGVVLIALAAVGWFALGLGSGLLAILSAVFMLISGIVFLVAGR